MAAIIVTTVYICLRGVALFAPGYGVLDRLLAVCLLLAEIFLFVHAIGYFLSTIRAARGYRTVAEHAFVPASRPMYAGFLGEASHIIEKPALNEIAAMTQQ